MVRGENTFLKSNGTSESGACCEALGGDVVGTYCEGAMIDGGISDFDLHDSCAYLNAMPEAVVEANSGSNGSGQGASTFADIFSGFNFGKVKEAYCEFYSLFNKGNKPVECKPKSSYDLDNQNSSTDDEGGKGKYIFIAAIVLLFVIGGYFLLRKK